MMVKEELLDFGVFGKWSKKTLLAQTTRCIKYLLLPKGVRLQYYKSQERFQHLKQEITNTHTPKEIIDWLNYELENIKLNKKDYDKMYNFVVKYIR